jgi:hypothetical protein
MDSIIDCKVLCYEEDTIAGTKKECWRRFSFDLIEITSIQESLMETTLEEFKGSSTVLYLTNQEQFVIDIPFDETRETWGRFKDEIKRPSLRMN